MKTTDYIDSDGREWKVHQIRDRFSGDEHWCAVSCDGSPETFQADTKAELFAMLEPDPRKDVTP